MRGRQIVRQWRLLLQLAEWRRGVTLENLAVTARVSSRTVRRDLEELSEAGFEIEKNSDRGGAYYRLLNPAAVLALELARRPQQPARVMAGGKSVEHPSRLP